MTNEDEMKQAIAGFVPTAIKRAFASYVEYSEAPQEINGHKDFAGHHSACKVAISHIELLLKLAKWAEVPEVTKGAGINNEDLEKLIIKANMEYNETLK